MRDISGFKPHSAAQEGSAERAPTRVEGFSPAAFERSLRLWRPRLIRFAARLIGQAEAEDALQDAVVRAWGALHRFRDTSAEPVAREAARYAWLLKILHNVCRNAAKAAGSDPEIDVAFGAGDEEASEDSWRAHGLMSRQDADHAQERQVRTRSTRDLNYLLQVTHLSPRERDVIVLMRQGLETEQIAERLGVSDNVVRAHLSTAIARLRACATTPAQKELDHGIDSFLPPSCH